MRNFLTYNNNILLLAILFFLFFFLNSVVEAAFFETKSNFVFFENLFIKKQKYILFLIFFFPSIFFFKKKNWLAFGTFLIFQIFVIIYWNSLIEWIQNLAGDSISEINTLNFDFIKSWFVSLFNYLEPDLRLKSFIKVYLIGFLVLGIFAKTINNSKKYLIYFPSLLGLGFVYFFININILHLIGNINTQKDVKKHFRNSSINYTPENQINLILFIGESTSSLHANKYINDIISSPHIQNLGKTSALNNVYATHTHSTPTLLRSLSVPSDTGYKNIIKPIVKRDSFSIFSLFSDKISKSYISSTGTSGYNNLHYPIFFKNFDKKTFLKNSKFNFEKDFFLNEYNKIIKKKKNNNLIVFHSSVGHAPYSKYIPKASDNIKINKKNSIKITGNKSNFFSDILNYEAAIKYNFENLKNIIKNIDPNVPTALIYYSDHGESVYTGIGHDSSRLVHEMLRIPVFIFYNKKFINLYEKNMHQKEKNFNKIKTGDIVPKLILNTYGLIKSKDKFFPKKNDIFENLIMRREKKDKIEVLDLNFERIKLPKNYSIAKAKDTYVNVLSANINNEKICYHAANTVARVKRGALITKCLEFDLVIEKNNFYIYHPPKKNINFTLDELINQADKVKSFWIDGKNINENNCELLFKKIKLINKKNYNILIEFPSYINLKNLKISSCVKKFRNIGVDASYYLPNKTIKMCLNKLSKKNDNCKKLLKTITDIDEGKIFNNVSFDYKFSKILKLYNYSPANLKLNTWHINYEEVKKINLSSYNLIIPFNSEFNKNNY